MALVPMKKLLENAREKGIAVGAFSVGNMEMVMGAVWAAEELNMPIILQIAASKARICLTVASTSSVLVLVMDWMAIG